MVELVPYEEDEEPETDEENENDKQRRLCNIVSYVYWTGTEE